MTLETASVWAALSGVVVIMTSAAASIGSSLTQSDLSQLTSILNSVGFGLMSFGAGGILYVNVHGG